MEFAPEQQQSAYNHLLKRVVLDKDTITYRLLSRELAITVQLAKHFLASYLQVESTVDRHLAVTWILSGTLKGPATQSTNDEMEIDQTQPRKRDLEEMLQQVELSAVPTRTVLLVRDSELPEKLQLFETIPSQHVYSLSPTPLDPITILTAFDLPAESPSIVGTKWKPTPENGYGGIVHPDGAARLLRLGTGSTLAPIPAKIAAKESKGKAVEKPVASTSNSTASTSKTKKKPSEPAPKPPAKASFLSRPIGSAGGLFAKVPPAAVVPKKKKLPVPSPSPSPSPPPKKKLVKRKAGKGNGAFADEEVDSDEEIGADEEEELRLMEEAAIEAKLTKEKAKKKKEVEAKKKAVLDRAKESERERTNRELEEMMNDDAEESAKKGTVKKGSEGSINSFFKKS